jgi:glycosyltransferase involved in cell wall biosynthesis
VFSIVVPLYNKASYICRAIDSILSQGFTDYEIIVVNDGSTDGGAELVHQKYGDQVTLIHQSNQGVSVARNRGIAQASQPYIAFLDADDFWHPQYLEFVSSIIKKHPNIGLIGCHYDPNTVDIAPELRFVEIQRYFQKAIRNTLFFTSATVLKKTFFDQNPGFDPQIKLGEDLDVWFRAALFFGNGIYIQNTLVYYELGDSTQATKRSYLLSETLLPKILSPNYVPSHLGSDSLDLIDFETFKFKWVYFNLFQFYGKVANREGIERILSQISTSSYGAVKMGYRLPFSILYYGLKNTSFRNLYRNYLKFCFRYLYS